MHANPASCEYGNTNDSQLADSRKICSFASLPMNLNELTIKETHDGLRGKGFSVKELVEDCLDQIEKKDPEIRAYLEFFSDARDQSKKADELLSQGGELPPLLGIPLAVKDNILIKDKKATAASKILEHYVAPYDATVIKKLKNHGAVFLGKTNMDEFAMGASTENSAFGVTRNPHDTKRVPGGSSGGSAAAVAADLCIAGLGSDTGGSIRQPAAFCGVVGLKPTYGAVSRHGLIAMASSLDQIGPLTKSVEDAKLLFDAIRGPDHFDATSAQHVENRNTKLEIPENLQGFRVGIPKEYFTSGLDEDVEKNVKAAIKKIETAGAEVQEISLPHSEYALAAYYLIVSAEVSANLARFDGIRYGFKDKNHATLFETYTKSRARGFGAEVKRRIMLGTYTLSAGYYDAYYLQAQKMRRLIQDDFKNAFDRVDVIMGPTAPTPAFGIGERTENPLEMYLADIYTVAINLAGVPAVSLPAGTVTRNGSVLPVGLQMIGRWWDEDRLLSIAACSERLLK